MERSYGQLWSLAVFLEPFLRLIYGQFVSYEPFSVTTAKSLNSSLPSDKQLSNFAFPGQDLN